MQHFSEHIIEQFLRDKTLESGTRRKIKAHLSECTECRLIYNWLKNFYAEWEALEPERHEWTENQSLPHYSFKLKPFNTFMEDPEHYGSSMVLAAQSTEAKQRFEHLVTLYSREDNIVARILYDHQNQFYQLYLIMQEQRRQRHVLVTLPYYQKELITDEKGRVEFSMSREPDPDRWEQIQGIMRMPLSLCTVKPSDFTKAMNSGRVNKSTDEYTFSLRFLPQQNQLEVKVDIDETTSNELNRLLLRDQAGNNQLLPLNNHKTTLDWNRLKTSERYTMAVYE